MKKIICILLALFAVFPLSACQKEEEAISTIKDYGKVYFEDAGEYKDGVGNTYNYSYKIPEFTIDSADAVILNNKIIEDFYVICEMEKASMEEGLSPVVLSISYEEFARGDIASFLIKAVYDSDYISYGAYSINGTTGKKVDGEVFLEMSGLPEEEFIGKIKKAAGNKYKEIYGNPEGKDYLMYAYNYTISDDAVNLNIPMFIGENGNLFAVAKIGSVAGAAYYEHVIDTEIKVIK